MVAITNMTGTQYACDLGYKMTLYASNVGNRPIITWLGLQDESCERSCDDSKHIGSYRKRLQAYILRFGIEIATICKHIASILSLNY